MEVTWRSQGLGGGNQQSQVEAPVDILVRNVQPRHPLSYRIFPCLRSPLRQSACILSTSLHHPGHRNGGNSHRVPTNPEKSLSSMMVMVSILLFRPLIFDIIVQMTPLRRRVKSRTPLLLSLMPQVLEARRLCRSELAMALPP